RRQADERQLRADLEPRFGHHLEDEGRLSALSSIVGAGNSPPSPRLRRHTKAARFPGSGRFLFLAPPAGEQEVKIRDRAPCASAAACDIPAMMFPVSTIQPVRAMAESKNVRA